MTSTEKSRIDELRAQGFGYKRIARMMGVSVSTVQFQSGKLHAWG